MKKNGFTLIEVLVVMLIISVLAGLILSAVEAARRQTTKTRAKHDIDQLKTGWLLYLNEYRHFPSDMNSIGSMDSNMVAMMRGVHVRNPRGVKFLESSESATNFADPWGSVYAVALDTDNNNVLEGVPGTTGKVYLSVATWSLGPDRVEGTADDIRSW